MTTTAMDYTASTTGAILISGRQEPFDDAEVTESMSTREYGEVWLDRVVWAEVGNGDCANTANIELMVKSRAAGGGGGREPILCESRGHKKTMLVWLVLLFLSLPYWEPPS